MLVVLSPIFVADTKITLVYNFVAPLKLLVMGLFDYTQIAKNISNAKGILD